MTTLPPSFFFPVKAPNLRQNQAAQTLSHQATSPGMSKTKKSTSLGDFDNALSDGTPEASAVHQSNVEMSWAIPESYLLPMETSDSSVEGQRALPAPMLLTKKNSESLIPPDQSASHAKAIPPDQPCGTTASSVLTDNPTKVQTIKQHLLKTKNPIAPPKSKQFSGGTNFIAGNINGQLVVWGGRYGDAPQPCRDVYIFRIKSDPSSSKLLGTWQITTAMGEIHPGRVGAASTVNEQSLFIFGGKSGGRSNKLTQVFSTLMATGIFKRLQPKGDIPSARYRHKGFAYNEKVYFIGGLADLDGVDESEKPEYFKHGAYYVTNSIHKYDPKNNVFSKVTTSGAPLKPRFNFGLAVLKDQVFVHCGNAPGGRINDFMMLDMKKLEWTKIPNTGTSLGRGICDQTLSKISDRELMLVGGQTGYYLEEVRIFDSVTSEWKDEDPLPMEICQESGLAQHRAVEIPKPNGVYVICVGGEFEFGSLADHMLVFDVTH